MRDRREARERRGRNPSNTPATTLEYAPARKSVMRRRLNCATVFRH